MRILCLTPWFPPYPGAQSGNFILDSVEALHAQGHEVKVVVTQAWHPGWGGLLHPDWGRPRLRSELHDPALGLDVLTYPSIPRNYLRNISAWLFKRWLQPPLEMTIRKYQPDVLLVHTEQAAAVATLAGATTGVPVVVVLHGINTSAGLNTIAEHARVRTTLCSAKRVVLVGEPLWQHFSDIAGSTENFRIVHNGFKFPPSDLVKTDLCWPSTVRFISVSNLAVGKGIDLNLRAFAKLYREGQCNWTYTIVGAGSELHSLQTLAGESGIAELVHFAGAVDHTAVYGLLAGADVFVLPSWREAFGVAWLEAMACGLLAVAVQGQGPATFITHEKTGLLVAPKDVADLAACLHRILDEPALMQRLAQKGRESVQRDFTWTAHATKLAAVCAEVTGINT